MFAAPSATWPISPIDPPRARSTVTATRPPSVSLINEALKKAQRQRNQPPPDANAQPEAAPVPAGPTASRVAKRATPMRAQSVLMLGAGALSLVVLSVVITIFAVNRPDAAPAAAASAPSTTAAPAAPAVTSHVDLNAPSPVIVAPSLPVPNATDPTGSPPSTSTPDHAAGNPAGTAPDSSRTAAPVLANAPTAPVASPAQAVSSSSSAAAAPPPGSATAAPAPQVPTGAARTTAAPPPRAANPQPDPRIYAFIDTLRVTGIRSSGNESKVLMNDRVYRVNDIVERAFGLRLIEVAPDSLTFADANDVTYKKNF